MHDFPLLINIAAALGVAFFGGWFVRLLGLPTIVGYLLAGIAIGPFTPGFVGDSSTINQLAELGVIFLMFGVGLHFSYRDLWKVRDIAIVGALGQMLTTAAIGYALSQWWHWSPLAGLVLGLAISVASTIVLLRGLMDHGLLQTSHGQVAIGWLVMEDLATVLILLVMPNLAHAAAHPDWRALTLTVVAALGFIAFMLFVGGRVIPWLLLRVSHTRSRELFVLAILTIALGTALSSAHWFGVSLALGAFMAGAVAGESPLHHRIAEDLLPFREAFAVLFFVSVGMLLNPHYLIDNLQPVLALTAVIVVGKFVVTATWASLFARPARTALVVAAGTSQIGEFSFILGQTGLSLGLLQPDQYALILAGALLSILLNPLMFRAASGVERGLQYSPRVWNFLDRHGTRVPPKCTLLNNQVVVIGCGRVGGHLIDVLNRLEIPCLAIDADPDRVEHLRSQQVPALLGDAANSDILTHAGLDRARIVVIALPEQTATELTVAAAHDLAPMLPIFARAATGAGITRLAKLGAKTVIHPELEGGLQLIRHTLLCLDFPLEGVRRYADRIRQAPYDTVLDSVELQRLLSEPQETDAVELE